MATVVRPHTYPDGVPARPDHANANEITLYTLVNGNLDWDNILTSLINAASGFVKLDSNADVPLAQIPDTLTGKDADTLDGSELADIVPSGVIVMWAGTLALVPSGWSLCDGTSGTPDLREKFVLGTPDGVDPGDTGGADSITLVTANMPSHSHSISSNPHTHTISPNPHNHLLDRGIRQHETVFGGEAWAVRGYSFINTGDRSLTIGNTSLTIGSTGSGTAFDNRPAYYKLAFIQKD